MKHTKKIVSLLLTLVMVLTMSVTAFAENANTANTGSITINNAVVGQTYTIYKILELESYDKDAEAYAYKATNDWNSFINQDGIKGTYVNVDDKGYVTWVEGASVADFAKAAQEYVLNNNIGNQGFFVAKNEKISFSNLELGYYLVDSTLGTLCSLDTTNPNATVNEKNGVPTNEKKVEEGGNWGESNDASIGDTVNFQSTITAQFGAENYVFHDKMDAGLVYNSVTGITLNDTKVEADNYTVAAPATDGDTFDIVFTQDFCNNLKANDKIVISYTATLNEGAVVAGAGNQNESKVEYGETGKTTTTPPSTTKTYTWSFDILKYGNGEESKVLQGAQFVLLDSNKTSVATIVNNKFTAWSEVPKSDSEGEIVWLVNSILTTGEDGKIAISGLDSGTYYLREIKAPNGYNKLTEDVLITIESTRSTDGETMSLSPVTVKVNNQSGAELPGTGGMGTTIIYIVGTILLVGAAVLLIVKKRGNAAK